MRSARIPTLSMFATTAILAVFAMGCAQFIDKVTSRDFKVRDLVSSPDPLTELRKNPDGDARVRAMRALKEPRKNGGSPDEQDEAIRLLSQAATADSRPLCRLAAVEALGRFEDPRTVEPLIYAFHQAEPMVPDVSNAIRSEVMIALGKKRTPEALGLLVKIAGDAKTETKDSATQQASFTSRSPNLMGDSVTDRDLRLAAIRALGDAKDPAAIPTLLPLLKEKDVAIRNRAHESLVAITGRKDLPVDAGVWERVLSKGPTPKNGEPDYSSFDPSPRNPTR